MVSLTLLLLERMQERSQLLETQAADLTAQLLAAQERNAVLQQELSSKVHFRGCQELEPELQKASASELLVKCRVCSHFFPSILALASVVKLHILHSGFSYCCRAS
jgi:hypothetical protein